MLFVVALGVLVPFALLVMLVVMWPGEVANSRLERLAERDRVNAGRYEQVSASFGPGHAEPALWSYSSLIAFARLRRTVSAPVGAVDRRIATVLCWSSLPMATYTMWVAAAVVVRRPALCVHPSGWAAAVVERVAVLVAAHAAALEEWGPEFVELSRDISTADLPR